MKKMLGIISAGLITSVVVYVLWNKTHKTKGEKLTDTEKEATEVKTKDSITEVNNNIYEEYDELNNNKSSSISAMYTRHEEASKIMKDAVKVICNRSEVSEDENNELEQISDELDKLLSGE